ncbi:[NiFe]-hydrogenase assembly chaperone HybE [Acetobacter suratthaniensis]|uniref:[NiFe]-hydrogenase assembly chaperone HybE n=1 Tax=Acetobacter suratthaniensis TaxID=1502841 RepID=A0ABS3LLC9_9PROT|nr:[NiFe]-hydrogenase assembly chaperone HybE [Acetobacter suratthaniensis]MBO1328172.1 [NiFe]-hydrogenase assembly chaperone HybE [Acetobacter suratthaniensis]MCX2566292.1 [NiFe]-hydrogenase assembly chaperone HybE [Acetobacter suratthaniensis]
MTAQAFHGFEGSYMGDATRLTPGSVMECKICWSLYDPAQGCETWQVPPGTPFTALPESWRCPTCDAPKEQFMVVHEPAPQGATTPDTTHPLQSTGQSAAPNTGASGMALPAIDNPEPATAQAAPPAALFAHQLEATFRDIHANQMRGVPLVNAALNVKAVGFQERDGHILGVLITPWFMNLVQAPLPDAGGPARTSGEKVLLSFPSGEYEFTAVTRDQAGGLSPYLACSLFSPMFDFTTMLQAIETAQAALVGLMDPTQHPAYRPAPASDTPVPARTGRRALLTGSQPGPDSAHP